MEALELKAQVRKEAGKGPARRLRMKGFIPAVFYGSGDTAQLLAVEMAGLSKYLKERKESVFIKLKIEEDGKESEKLSMIKELQTSPVSNKPVHADFLEIRMDHKISLEVPIHFVGHPVGVELGGELQLLKRELRISGLPGNVPESVQIDISGLEIGDSLNEGSVHKIYLDVFYIDRYEVTNAQYKKFMDATGYKAPLYWKDSNYNTPNQPVIGVNWHDAKAYADWAGKRLPTETEWEKAARGGLVGKRYVWGNDWPPPKNSGNFADETAKKTFPDWSIINGYDDGYAYTAPVGKFTPNGYGLYDMEGNVWEWCSDWYDANYYSGILKSNPKGLDSGEYKVVRGGNLFDSHEFYLRVATRNFHFDPTYRFFLIGFRCIQDIPK